MDGTKNSLRCGLHGTATERGAREKEWLSADLRLQTGWDLQGAEGRDSRLDYEINVRAVGKSRTSDKRW